MIIKYNGEGSLIVPVKGREVTVTKGVEVDVEEAVAIQLLGRVHKTIKQWVEVKTETKKKAKEGDEL